MSSLVEDLMGDGLRILLLGSYDDITKGIMHNLQTDLDDTFQRYMCTTLLVENMDIHIALAPGLHDYSIFFENEGIEKGVFTLIRDKTKPVEKLEYDNVEQFRKSIGSESGNIDFSKFRPVSELEKLVILNDWADIVYLIKNQELTRGGELVELTYLLHQHQSAKTHFDPLKYEFFYKQGIPISIMVKEMVNNNKIAPIEYSDYDELKDKVITNITHHISRLNSLIGRFKRFE